MKDKRQISFNQREFTGLSVVYVMSRDQRVRDNHALAAAQEKAAEHKVPLYVLFVLKHIEGRYREHYEFMLDGLREVAEALEAHNIQFVLRSGDAAAEIPAFLQEVGCGALYFDFSPLRYARILAKSVAKNFGGPVFVVDTHNIIPVWVTSDKQEFAAHTIRTKIHTHLETYLVEPAQLKKHPHKAKTVSSLSWQQADDFIAAIPNCGIQHGFDPGEAAAKKQLDIFIQDRLDQYAVARNGFSDDQQSNLSPFLHFGQISALRVALDVMKSVEKLPLLFQRAKMAEASDKPSKEEGMNTLFEELIVRKELSDNFCLYGKDYLSLDGAPDWARKTLTEHAKDPREFVYSKEEWEAASTHDDAWNAAQTQLARTGKLHGYLRMYWAKKLLEWSKTPEEALATAIYLNDKYSIDGGDPNGYVGILWSIAGLHDRPWFERSVYGKIRYMNAAGLRRKYDLDTYVREWS